MEQDQIQEGDGESSPRVADHTPNPDISSLAQMMQAMLEDRRQREAEITEERRRQEHDAEERMRGMREQIDMLQRIVSERHTTTPRRNSDQETLRLTRLTEQDDIEAYLLTFERMMQAYEIDRARWTFKLAPQLTGKAQQAYAALSADEATDYNALRTAILRRYNINEETYRRQFRSAELRKGETPRELVTRLTDLARKWSKDCSTFDELLDLVVKEQLVNCLPEGARVWVRERKAKTSAEAGELAEDFLQARATENEGRPKMNKTKRSPPGNCPRCGQPGHWASDCPKNPGKEEPNKATGDKPKRLAEVQCFNCKEKGHFSYKCPKNSGLYCDEVSTPALPATEEGDVYRSGCVNGMQVGDIILDTGASRTLVRGDLVPPRAMLEEEVTIRCAHGDAITYPLAQVTISVGPHLEIAVKAAVSKTLPAAVLLGRDVPELMSLLSNKTEDPEQEPSLVLVATTRAQARKQQQEEVETDGHTKQAETTTTSGETELEDLPNFDSSLFTGGREKPRLTRSQKRAIRQQHTLAERLAAGSQVPLDITAGELRKFQASDSSLDAVRKTARRESEIAGRGVFNRDGLLYRRYVPPGSPQLGRQDDEERAVDQLVLPIQCRDSVLRLAHTIPLAGHLGRTKTADRILQRFYWPTVFRDVANYCKSCPECQKSSPRRTQRAPLVPLPIMDEPFSRIAMDIVGPLPRSRSGKKYILVICDYATRYPEAIALRSIDAECIAEELMHFFARVGLPREILTDQGSNFTSHLLTELYRLLHVKPIKTTPYHPQTDGLVERLNQTLKAMLRRVATEEGKDWDKLIPYLLFAYREVPQASTGFSPFELLYGRQVRGPLDVLRETWEASIKSSESVVSYVLSIQEKLAKLQELVRENLKEAQKAQKTWYDRNARNRELKPGDQVLVLLPTTANRLLAEWQGPYPIIRRIGEVVYEIDMKDRRRRKRRFHINMLREWVAPKESAFMAEEVDSEEDEDIVLWDRTSDEPPTFSTSLTTQQNNELQQLLCKFGDVLRGSPGRTSVVEHCIETENASPIRLAPYRLPHAYRDTVKDELREMEQAGIIEPSSSPWAAPIIPVKKKDGSMRLCVDYRRLNSVSRTDAYPMPRVDDLIDRIGGAKFITTLDLSKGYWQVPVREQDRPKTAFTSPQGLFQFRVMPFGLQGAPATFQRMMDSLLRGLGDTTAAYLDDIVIHSETWEEHLQHIQAVLQRLREAKLTIKPKKCQFGMSNCTYLGHVVGNGQVKPEMAKVEAVRKFPQPKTKRQVRAFLGLTGYYRKFIPHFASIAAPLTDLTRRNRPTRVTWTDQCQDSFVKLRESLCNSPVLRSPDFTKEFILQTDASDRGIGAVLSQQDDDGVDHPISFYSRKLLPREERYATVEKECLAIKAAVEAFKVYLLGRHFTITTDHRALEWLSKVRDKNARLTRWSLALQPYYFDVVYRKGSANANADGLSRAYEDDPTNINTDDCVAGEGRGSVSEP